MKFEPPVQRVEGVAFGRKYHYYVDGNERRIPGVTTILGAGIPKPKLINWAANATAEGAVDNWDELSELPPAKRLKALQGIRYETTDAAKNKGTLIHGYAERLVQGEKVEDIPPELRGYTEAYVRFIDEWQLDPILIEVVIVNYRHGYAGTLDLVAELTSPLSGERETYLLDIKTGATGVFGETALQLAAYRFAEFYVDQDDAEQPMIAVEGTAAIHVTPDEAMLKPTVSAKEQYDLFRMAQRIGNFVDDGGLILPELRHAKKSTAHVVWEDQE